MANQKAPPPPTLVSPQPSWQTPTRVSSPGDPPLCCHKVLLPNARPRAPGERREGHTPSTVEEVEPEGLDNAGHLAPLVPRPCASAPLSKYGLLMASGLWFGPERTMTCLWGRWQRERRADHVPVERALGRTSAFRLRLRPPLVCVLMRCSADVTVTGPAHPQQPLVLGRAYARPCIRTRPCRTRFPDLRRACAGGGGFQAIVWWQKTSTSTPCRAGWVRRRSKACLYTQNRAAFMKHNFFRRGVF